MRIAGTDAARYDAVDRDSYETINKGVLVEADEDTGHVAWNDKTGVLQTVTLGMHRVKLIPRGR